MRNGLNQLRRLLLYPPELRARKRNQIVRLERFLLSLRFHSSIVAFEHASAAVTDLRSLCGTDHSGSGDDYSLPSCRVAKPTPFPASSSPNGRRGIAPGTWRSQLLSDPGSSSICCETFSGSGRYDQVPADQSNRISHTPYLPCSLSGAFSSIPADT